MRRLSLTNLRGRYAYGHARLHGRPGLREATAEVPAAYKEMDGWKVAEPKDHLIRGAWWEIFNDPELNALEEQVNISNQNVAAAEAQFRQAARWSRLPGGLLSDGHDSAASFTRSLRSSNVGGSTGRTTTGTSSKPPTKSSTAQHNDKPYF